MLSSKNQFGLNWKRFSFQGNFQCGTREKKNFMRVTDNDASLMSDESSHIQLAAPLSGLKTVKFYLMADFKVSAEKEVFPSCPMFGFLIKYCSIYTMWSIDIEDRNMV